jgi:hypothetical protein
VADPNDTQADDLNDELAKKYDPDLLLKMFSKRVDGVGRKEPLPHQIQAKYERMFGVNLGHVRVITGAFAEQFNERRRSQAVTVGNTGMILMGKAGAGAMAMGSAEGKALLAHEITHVAQQVGGLHAYATGTTALGDFSQDRPELERQAHDIQKKTFDEANSAGDQHKRKQEEARLRERTEQQIIECALKLLGDDLYTQRLRNPSGTKWT